MRMTFASAALAAAWIVSASLVRPAQAEPSSQEEPAVAGSAETAIDPQAHVAEVTGKLEDAFTDQFVRGTIDRGALANAIDETVQAFPEAARPKVQAHIDEVLSTSEKLVPQLSPEERADAAAPPEPLGTEEQAALRGWGWGRARGFGGVGAFGFPSMLRFGGRVHAAYGRFGRFGCRAHDPWCGLGRRAWFWR
jgi:hypothetical protein